MSNRAREAHTTMRETISIIVIFCVFGLATFLVIAGYSPDAVAASVTATSLATAELVRRIRETSPDHRKAEDEKKDPK